MISAIRAAPPRVLFLAVAVAVVGLMTVTDLPSASPVHAQEQAVTATRDATGESPPARPTDLQASAKHDSVSLTWTASTDQTVTHYAVLRRDRDKADAGVFKVIDGNAGSATSYTDRSVSPEDSYVYRVKAVSPTGVSQWSSYARADIPTEEDLAPSGLSAKVVSGDDGVIEGVALAWDAPAADAESVTGYEILRAVGDGDLTTLAAGTGSAGTTYADGTATEAGESYAYRVKALRGEETSQPSERAVAFIPKVTAVPVEPPIAEEQSGTTAWVSNTAQTLISARIVLGNTDKRHSQGFTTGAETGGYSLGSVGVHVDDEDLESGETLTVHIYTASADGAIDTLVHTLISPDSYEDRAVNLFTAPAGATLAPNTDYLVVFEATGDAANDFSLSLTNSTSEDSGSATGWSIEDSRRYDNSTFNGVLVISVNAAAEEQGTALWAATLTVGEIDAAGRYGYQGSLSIGSLAPATFDVGTTTYTVTHLFDNDNVGGTTYVRIILSPILSQDDAGNLTLHLRRGTSLSFGDATYSTGTGISRHLWTRSTALGWSTGDAIVVGITQKVDAVSTDATLSELSLSGVTLSPSFAADTLAYTGSVDNSVTSTTVTATANDDGATVAIVPADADDTADSHQVTLGVGDTAVSVTVTAEDGTTTQTYAVTVTRAEAAEQDTAIWSATLTVKSYGLGSLGCSNSSTGATCNANLSDTSFEYGGTTYSISHFFLRAAGTLELAIGTTPNATTITDLTLNIGVSPFPLSTAIRNGYELSWPNSGLTLTADTDVTVTLTQGTAAPAVSDVDVTSEPGDDDTYAIGDTIEVTVTFDQAVTVTGAPRIKLRVGGGDAVHLKWADYTSGSGNEALLFAYTVQADDFDDNGIYIAADELELNGGTIQSSDGTDANLDYPLQGGQSGHNVDGVRPTPQSAATSLDGSSVIIIFSESLSATTAPASAFTLSVDTATAPAVSTATASGDTVTLGLASALTSDQVVTVTYVDATSGNDAAAVQDAAGNDADTFTQTVYNNVAIEVPADWGLIPSGLGAGAEFRLIFLSSTTRDGTSTDIADYNTFVQTAAAAGHADIQDYSSTFRVVGSTADVDARDNTATTYTADDKGVPIYWLGGNKVVDDYEDFYDGDWDDEANPKNESGNNRSISLDADLPFTGSEHDGTEAFNALNASRALGASLVQFGAPTNPNEGPLGGGATTGSSFSRPFYGLSPVFRVSDQVVTNTAPAFTTVAAFSMDENQTILLQVMAMDADAGDEVTYAVTGGADLALFSINTTFGLLGFPTRDYENPTDADGNNVYLVTVTATGGTGVRALTTDQAITVTVNDVDEPPSFPAAPTVSAVDGSSDSLSVTWTAPGNFGKPDIESYDLQYRKGTTGNYIDGPQDVTGTSAIIGGLEADSAYQVRVRATNDEGDSLWSSAGSGTTNAAAGLCLLPAGPLWSACLTVGEIDSAGRYGYQASNSTGSLAPATFDVGTTTYTVTHLFDNDNVGGTTYVRIILSPILSQDDAGNLTLHLGDGTSFSFGDATYSTGTGISRHLWTLSAALGWSTGETIVVGITQEEQANTAPAFTTVANFSTNENQAATFQVTAMDPDDGDEVTYAITGGADLALFSINATSGLLAIPVSVDHENPADADGNNVYLVTVTATGGTGTRALTTDQAITVTVNDVDEPPSAPAVPTVSAVSNSSDSLSVSWTAPDNAGKPDIESYDLQYRKGTTGSFTDGPQDVTDTTTIISGLDEDSLYQVQVRATNDEGDSAWSSAGSGTTGAAAEAPGVLAINQSDGTYAIEAKLSLSVVFSAEVTVSGTPQLALDIGGETRHADYESGTGTNLLLFSYIVAEGDEDTDGIGVPANSLALNGGTITAGGLAAGLLHPISTFPSVLVDGVRPIFVSAETNEAGTRFFLTFSEPISAVSVNAAGLAGGNVSVTLIEIDGAVVELDPGLDFAHDTTWTIDFAMGVVRDLAGNPNSSSSNNPITNNVLAVCGPLPTDRLWSACLTVGAISTSGRTGYTSSPSVGTLVPATFDVGTTTHTVTHLFDNDDFGGDTYVEIILSPVLSEDDAGNLTLHLGDDTSLSFADATYSTGTGWSSHTWFRTAALGWSEGDAIVVGITQEEQVNTAPSFLLESSTREVAENSAAGVDVGGPVTATDTDTGDTLTYTLEGTDAASFTIGSTSGQIQTETGVTYDHESQPEYSVTVKADDGNGGTDTIAVTIDIADVDEPPSAPAEPTVSAVSGTTDSLEVTWTAPDNAGKPDIESYDLQYRKGTTGNWIDGPQDETGLTATIGGLDEASAYQVQVRATNDEGDGPWSSPGSGSTNAPAEEMAETTVPADWSLIPGDLGPGDSFRLIFIGSSNTNANSSDIDVYNTFVQNLVAASGHADIKALSGTFRMLGSTEAVDARDNTGTTGTGVPIYWLGGAQVADDYADFYDGDWDEEATGARETGASVTIGTNWEIWTGSAHDGTEAMHASLGTSRALGNSGNEWVMHGNPNGSGGPIEGSTATRSENKGVYGLSGVFTVSDQPIPNAPPAFSSDESFSVEENQTDAGTVIAADPDAVDAVTYAVTGGADQAKFDIGASSGVLTFKDAPDHENPTDAGGNNTYMVTVTATGGTGDRAMTAEQSITVTVTDVAETPAVDDLDVTSTPKADIDTYGREETIEVTVTFDQAVNVTGTPRIRLRIGGGMQEHYRWADYDRGTGTRALRFTYVVVEGDMDDDGIYILENELFLNSGTVQGVDDDVAADLDYPRQGTQSGHKVDGSLRSTNTDPAFDRESAVRELRENTGAGEYVGDPFTATDEDGDTLTYSLEGDDAGSFAINSRTGQILTREGVTYDYEDTTEYSVRVKADDGERGDATVEVAIHVIDVAEPPLAPRAPTLSDGPDDSGRLDVTWKTPDNSGRPDIESYDLRYRKTGAENWRNGPQDVTGLTATIGGLDADSDYQVQVRATNDEGDGEWSPSRSTTYPTGPVIEVDDNGDGVVDADPEVTLVLGSTVSYRVRPGRCEGYKTLVVQRMSGASEGAPPHIPVDASQEVSPMPCMGEDDPGEWQTVTLAVPLDLWLELLLETRFEASVEHSVYYRRSLTDRYSPLLLWGHLVRVLAPAPETLNPVGSLTVEPDARDYPRVTWSAVPGATGYQVQWRWGPDEEYGRVHRQEGSTYSREKRTGETAYTIPISETVPTTDEGVERSQPITVRVRPYDSKGLAVGPWREALLAGRTEVRKVLAGFSLLDADGSSQGLLAALADGATVELAYPDGGSYAIRAELVEGELAGSVHLELTGKKRVRSTENDAPYLLAGGEGMALPAGSYTLEATAYGGPDRTYAVQHTLEVSFTVTAAASGQPGSGELNVEEDEEEETEPLTARFEGLPEAGHGGGGTPFAFQLVFSEAVSTTPEALRDHALAVTNATVEAASRVDGRSDLWEVRLTPESDAMVTVSLSPLAGCDAAGAVCTEDGRMLSVGVARVILGPPPNSPATGQPTISGTAQVGQTLTADTSGIDDEDGLDNVTFSYQWMADDANIQGATGSSYTLADRDEGKAIKVIVSFTDDANNEESLPSAATDAVTALPGKPQSLAGKATTQEIQLAWKAPTGPAVVEYVVYRGILQNGSMNGQALSKYATIDAAGAAMAYTDDNVEEGVEYRYRVAAVNSHGEGKKSNWLDITAE